MGVTIHFQGQLISEQAFRELVELVSSISKAEGWRTELIAAAEKKLLRVRDEKDWDYTGPVKGIAVYLHSDCDPVLFEFDKDLYVQEYTKTQFAGADYHIKVVNLLKATQRLFREFRVEDEGQFWDTGDRTILQNHLDTIQRVLEDMVRKNPNARVKVKESYGKISDFVA
jgi:hypothetical protein